MAKSKCSRIIVAAALLVSFTVANVRAQITAKSPSDELLRVVPAESLFCARVNNFDYTLSRIDQFLAGVSPVPMATSMLVRMQLAQLFGQLSRDTNGQRIHVRHCTTPPPGGDDGRWRAMV